MCVCVRKCVSKQSYATGGGGVCAARCDVNSHFNIHDKYLHEKCGTGRCVEYTLYGAKKETEFNGNLYALHYAHA